MITAYKLFRKRMDGQRMSKEPDWKKTVSSQGRKIHQVLKENRKLRIMLRELTKIMVQDSKKKN